MSRATIRLLSSITDHYRAEVAAAAPGFLMLTDALHAIAACPYPKDSLRAIEPPARTELPACCHLGALADDGPLKEIASRFKAAEPHLVWQQGPPGTEAGHEPPVRDGHAFTEIVGPDRLFRSANTRIGLLLLAPGTGLPEHQHPAEEVYHVVSGSIDGWQQGEEWTSKAAGTAIHHPAGIRHAVRCGAVPALLVYCWRGRVEVAEDEDAPAEAPKARGRGRKAMA